MDYGHNSKNKHSGKGKAGILLQWETDLESYAVKLSEFHVKPILKEMQIPFDELNMLSMFLVSEHALKTVSSVL